MHVTVATRLSPSFSFSFYFRGNKRAQGAGEPGNDATTSSVNFPLPIIQTTHLATKLYSPNFTLTSVKMEYFWTIQVENSLYWAIYAKLSQISSQ